MKLSKIAVHLTMMVALLFVFISLQSASAQTETVLYSFKSGADGGYPHGRLFMDSSGSLYGTTYSGGAYGGGTVFELSPSESTWKETVLWNLGGLLDGKYHGAV
jgi:uncharacterized repeat protein (TIGR03803 family)